MVEPEIAFAHLEDVADLAEDYVKYLIGYALDNCQVELKTLILDRGSRRSGGIAKWKRGLFKILEHVRKTNFIRVTNKGVEILSKADKKFEHHKLG